MRTTPRSAESFSSATTEHASIPRPAPLLLDPKAAAGSLAIGARTLWTLTKCEAIPSRRIGRAVRYCPDELRAWVAAGCPTEPGAGDRIRKEVGR